MGFQIDVDVFRNSKMFDSKGKLYHTFKLFPFVTQPNSAPVLELEPLVGSFLCRIEGKLPKQISASELVEKLKEDTEIQDGQEELFFETIRQLFFSENGSVRPMNLHLIEQSVCTETSENRIAEYLVDVLGKIEPMKKSLVDAKAKTNSNVLESFVLSKLEFDDTNNIEEGLKYYRVIDSLRESFEEDFQYILEDSKRLREYLVSLLELYFFTYTAQVSLQLSRFIGGKMDFVYKFPVVRGIQARREYYIAMIPLRMLGRLFPNEEEFVLPEYRAQRKLNEARIPVISKYITENQDTYVFSALAASIDGEFKFIPSTNGSDVGILEISMDAKFLINDGQHRKAAIIDALNEDPSLGTETISIVLYEDNGLSRSQQIFTDLNKHAVKTSNSISELYDSRDEVAVLARNIVSSVPFFNEYTDKEKDNLGKYSSNLFTLNTFYRAIKKTISGRVLDDTLVSFLFDYWKNVSEHIVPWNELTKKEI